MIRIPSPSVSCIHRSINTILDDKKVSLDGKTISTIIHSSKRNATKAVTAVQVSVETDEKNSHTTDWETYLSVSVRNMCERKCDMLYMRSRMEKLLSNCIPPSIIIKALMRELIARMSSSDKKMKVVHFAALYEHRMQQGNKPILHLEAFFLNAFRVS